MSVTKCNTRLTSRTVQYRVQCTVRLYTYETGWDPTTNNIVCWGGREGEREPFPTGVGSVLTGVGSVLTGVGSVL